jgi:phytoene desaturase
MERSIDRTRVAVVGAGLGGLSSAIRLAAAGYRVDVFDKQEGPGGKAFTEQHGAYRFDTGPSLFTLAPVFQQLFQEAGRSLYEYLTLRPLAGICNYFWRSGKRMTSYADRERLAGAFAHAFGEDPEHVRTFLDKSREIYEITHHLFLEKSLHEWSTYRSRGFWSSLFQLHKIDALRTMDRATTAYFDAPEIRQFFNRYATYNGSDPYQNAGNPQYHPPCGVRNRRVGGRGWNLCGARGDGAVGADVGVQFHYGEQVERIATVGNPGAIRRTNAARVTGVIVGGRHIEADVVISNADVTPTYENLLRDTDAPLYRRYQKLEPSSSGLVFYWGVGKRFSQLGLHNIFFSDDYRREFSEIFNEGRCPTDPTIYVNITSKEGAPGDAPTYGENWFILVNAPADRGQDWGAEADRVRAVVIDRLSRELGTDIAAYIEEESRMTPPEIAEKTDSPPRQPVRDRLEYPVGGVSPPPKPLAAVSGTILCWWKRASRRRYAPGCTGR